jgi:hypothetical protein
MFTCGTGPNVLPTETAGAARCVRGVACLPFARCARIAAQCACACAGTDRASVCAGLYIYGVAGSNECPAKTARIVDTAMCERASAAAGLSFYGSTTSSNTPRGCSVGTSSRTFLNTDLVGAGQANSRLLCTVPTGAPGTLGTTANWRCRVLSGVRGRSRGCRLVIMDSGSADDAPPARVQLRPLVRRPDRQPPRQPRQPSPVRAVGQRVRSPNFDL